MWYDNRYEDTIQVIKNFKTLTSQKEYRNIAKELDLLSPTTLNCITGLSFRELLKKIRKTA